jgi:phosphoribosylformimino-5-aminoimidazole carboxamide ribotide isomerase
LDGAREKHVVNLKTLERVAKGTNLIIDFGGGVQSQEDLENVFHCGAQMVTAGSIAVRNPDLVLEWMTKFGAGKIILGADYNQDKIAVSGWQESTDLTLTQFIQFYYSKELRQVICTDIQKDGTLGGPAWRTYKHLKEKFPDILLIASGGIGNMDDIHKLNELNMDGVIIGKAIYERKIDLKELEPFLC